MRQRLTFYSALIAATLALSAPASAQTDITVPTAPTDSAIAINTTDNSSVFELAFNIRRVMGDVVDQSNLAVAYSKCTSCKTVAISIQILLVTGSPSVVTPQNVAIAINEACNLCQTLATAYQFVFGSSGPVRFTKKGRREIWRIRRELEKLRGSDLPVADIQARVDDLMKQLGLVLKTELVPVRDHDQDYDDQARQRDQQEQQALLDEQSPPDDTATETSPSETTPSETTGPTGPTGTTGTTP
jgi:putative peptide zinc metalloprotease protein